MAKKIVKVDAVQDCNFKMLATAGDHVLTIDQAVPMGGKNAGPNPLEYSLVAVAACIGAIGRIIANQRKLAVREIKVSVVGEMDTDNLLGISKDKRAGFKSINVDVDFDADMTHEEKIALLK